MQPLLRRSLVRTVSPLVHPPAAPLSAAVDGGEQLRGKYFGPLEVRDGVAIIRIDGPEKMNSISEEMRVESEKMWVDHIEGDASIKAAVFISSKSDNFIAGADVKMLKAVENKADLKTMCMSGHDLFDRIRSKGIPLVAAINGACLGGGLEWAMKCDYRIATTDKKTKLGLPEVKLGLLPGWGGTQNLPKLVGYQQATTMILMGQEVRPDKAKKIGLVDLVLDPSALETVAVDHARQLADGTLKPKRKQKDWMRWAMEDTPPGRHLFWQQVDKQIAKAGGHFPALPAIKACLQEGQKGGDPRKALEFEAEQFVKCAETEQHKALLGLFDGMTAVKKNRFGTPDHPVSTIAVVGAGLMGAGIAQVSAEKGYRVLLKDRDDESVSKGVAYMGGNWGKKQKRRRMSMHDRAKADSSVIPLSDDTASWKKHFSAADMVIEAVFEDIDLKHKVVKDMEAVTPDHCIFATNTSALPIGDIAKASSRPENLVGMHYFSPVPQMQLLEIIKHEGTSNTAAAAACAVGIKQGKLPIVVGDVPGFYVNRCLGPFMAETMALIGHGVSPEALDKDIKAAGMPVGPITLVDEVGIDVAAKVQKFLSGADLGVRMSTGVVKTQVLAEMMEKGFLGKKTKKGFFLYDEKGKRQGMNPEVLSRTKELVATEGEDLNLSKEEVQNRIVSRFVNEAVLCLQDGVLENAADGDIGAVFGCGFLIHTGGPFRMLDSVGIGQYCDMMHGLADKYGGQFEPCQLMKDMARENRKFHK